MDNSTGFLCPWDFTGKNPGVGSSPGNLPGPGVKCISRILYHWATREAHNIVYNIQYTMHNIHIYVYMYMSIIYYIYIYYVICSITTLCLLYTYTKIFFKSVTFPVMSNSVWPHGIACQAPLPMAFPRQEYWSGQPFPTPRALPDSGIKPGSPTLQADSKPSEPPFMCVCVYIYIYIYVYIYVCVCIYICVYIYV